MRGTFLGATIQPLPHTYEKKAQTRAMSMCARLPSLRLDSARSMTLEGLKTVQSEVGRDVQGAPRP